MKDDLLDQILRTLWKAKKAGSILHRETGSLKLAQLQLGHSNIGTTGDIYTHVDEAALGEAAEILGEVLGNPVVNLLEKMEDCTDYVQ